MKTRIVIFLLVSLVATGHVARAQEKLAPALGTAKKCEEAKALLDALRNGTGAEGVIVLVARLGDGESSRLNRRRLNAAWSYLHHAGQFPEGRLVKAEGERVRGRGRVELYAQGELMLVLMAARPNDDIVGAKSCGPY